MGFGNIQYSDINGTEYFSNVILLKIRVNVILICYCRSQTFEGLYVTHCHLLSK
jgi:hypothetical protein